jgi:nicotinamidase-related amidase
VRHAGDLDYRVVLAEDACVAFSPELHDWAIRYMADNFATVHSTEELLASLSEAVA